MRVFGFWLLVVGLASQIVLAQNQVYLAIDASESMNGLWDGETKWEKCEQSLKTIAKHAPPTLNLGVVTFGGATDGCDSVSMVVTAKRHNRSRLRMGLPKISPSGNGPLVGALDKMVQKMPADDTRVDWIILSDGGPYCEGNLCAKAEFLHQQFPQLRIHIVGTGLTLEDRDRLACLSKTTGGRSYNATSGQAIDQALAEITKVIGEPAPEMSAGKASLSLMRKANFGQELPVDWKGPSGDLVAVAIFAKKDAGQFRMFDWKPIREGESTTLKAPDLAGNYELRYLVGENQTEVAKAKLKVKRASARITAPAEAEAGSNLEITWQGPAGQGDQIVIFGTKGQEARALAVSGPLTEATISMMAPTTSGDFEIRYQTGSTGQVLARQAIKLQPPKVAVGSARQTGAGTLLKVRWQGPAAEGDKLAITGVGRDQKIYRFQRVLATNGETDILVPDQPGSYMVRYISGIDNKVLGEHVFRATRVNAAVKAEAEVAAGADVEVSWTGPGGPGDILAIYGNRGDNKISLITRYKLKDETPVTMLAPDYPGNYRLRYVTGQSQRILAETKLKVTEVKGSVSVLKWVRADKDFEVKFTGPGNRLDVIALMDHANPERPERVAYKAVGRGGVVYLKAPIKPGLYEVRYLMGQSQRVLAKKWVRIRK